MRKVLITESALRGLLQELMNSSAPIHANPVVDPSAAETDPANQRFIPSNKLELLPALRALVEPVDDDKVPEIYVMIKDALEQEKEDNEMEDNKVVEALIRKEIRKILKEALPVSPPPRMPVPKVLPSSMNVDDEIRKMVDAGSGVDAVVDFLKTLGFKTSEAKEEAQRRFNKIQKEKDVKAREEFLKTKQVAKLPSGFKPWPVEEYKEKSVATRSANLLDNYLYKIDFKKMAIGGVSFDQAGEAYRSAYVSTMEEMSGAQPYEIVNSKQFKKNFNQALVDLGIKNPPKLDDVFKKIGIQAAEVLGETIKKRSEQADDAIEEREMELKILDAAGSSDDDKTKQNISKAAYTLKEVSKALKLSISMIKKTEVIALAKYVLGIKSEIFEFIPDEPAL